MRWFLMLISVALLTVPTANAVDLFYDFEGSDSQFALDRLTEDGAQNGRYVNNVATTSSQVPFGSQAALFEPPGETQGVPPFSTLEIPETDFDLDFSLTVAMHVENKESPLDFTRLFSTFQGTGPLVPERSIFLDYDPTGAAIPGLRAIVNSVALTTDVVPDGMSEPGYHHFALTINGGDVTAYFDGEEVINGFVDEGYSNDIVNIHIGEDPHDGGGTANEQLIGNFDEVLVIERALSADEIALLADGNLVSNVVTPEPGERAVYYDFEGDTGTTFTDKFTADGSQNGIANRVVSVDDNGINAKLGGRSAQIDLPSEQDSTPFSQIDVGAVGDLGDQFTLSAVVNVAGGGYPFDGLTRLFSSFKGTGPVGAEELVFDFDPNASVANIGMRLLLPGGDAIVSNETFSTDENHTLTATYDDGEVVLYLDGEEVASDAISFGNIDLGDTPLKIGEDIGGIVNENFIGIMDDVLILSRALSQDDVVALAAVGAAEFLGIGGLLGDFDGNGLLDVADINLLTEAAAAGNHDASFDLNQDAIVDGGDVALWVTELQGTWIGDSNLDGEFNSSDLVNVFVAGKFEMDVDASWQEGDWDGNGRFESGDLVSAFIDGGFEAGPRAAVTVPEPTSAGVALCLLVLLRRSIGSRQT